MSYDGHKVLRAKVPQTNAFWWKSFSRWFQVEDAAQASALHQLSEIGFYDFWTEVKKMFPLFLEFLEFEEIFRF